MFSSLSFCSFFTPAVLCILLVTACGTKPDGTPYGVDPARTDVGRHKNPVAFADSSRRPHDAIGMPKGAEVNAVTGAAKAGSPLTTQPL